VILDRVAAELADASVGESIFYSIEGLDYTGVVTGVVDAFPSTDPTIGALVVDFQSWQLDRHSRVKRPVQPTEWWIASGEPALATSALERDPALAPDLVSSTSIARDLEGLGQTTLGALFVGFAAALAFAVVGFVVQLVIGSHERASELAVLRAIGLSRGQVLGVVGVEQAFLVGLGVVVGVGIGVGVSALVVPLVVISPTAERTVPAVLLEVPWPLLTITAAAAIALFAVVVLITGRRLHRSGLGSALRLGEDR
jgi:hypothetical protein